MGRPRKVTGDDQPVVAAKNLKDCPKCGEAPVTKIDRYGFFRTHCPVCGFWDCMSYHTADESVEGWQAAGGPGEGW